MILNAILAVLSALLLVALFPNYNLAFLAPVALTPLLIAAAREPRLLPRFGFGLSTGLIYWFGLCNWIQWTLEHHAGVSTATAWFLFVLFCLAKTLQTGLFAALAGYLPQKYWTPPAVAALWVAVEYTHSWTGFEWLNLGNAASDMSFLLRLAPITGVWGLSFVFALMSAVIAAVILRRQRLVSLWLLLLPCHCLPARNTRSAARPRNSHRRSAKPRRRHCLDSRDPSAHRGPITKPLALAHFWT